MNEVIGSKKMAGDAMADIDAIVANRLTLEHLVERTGTEHLGRRDIEQLGQMLHGIVGDIPILFLRKM